MTSSADRSGAAERGSLGDNEPAHYLIRFVIDNESVESEGLWGEATDKPDEFVIDNIPFHARGVDRGDTVRASWRQGELVFERVLRSGGRSTWQVLLRPEQTERDLDRMLDDLQDLGAGLEGVGGRLLAIDAPTENASEVTRVLEAACTEGTIWYETRG